MKRNKGKINIILGIFIIILFIIVIIVVINRNKKENNNIYEQNYTTIDKHTIIKNGTVINNSSKLKEEKTVGDFIITNCELTYDNGTKLVGNVRNDTSRDKNESTMITITLIDENENELGMMIGSIPPINAKGTAQFNSYLTEEIMNVYDVKVEAYR